MRPTDEWEGVRLYCGDALAVLPTLEAASVDAVCVDPPYGLEFMGKEWDDLGTGRKGNPFDPKGPAFEKGGTIPLPPTPRFDRKKMPKCKACGKWQYNASKVSQCSCEAPDWVTDTSTYPRKMQGWHHGWATEALRVLKPGGYLASFGGTRTYHRLACALEDAGFEVRDCIMWLYGTGFPKGQGCLKPSYEPVLLARRPGPRVLPLGIDECRVPTDEDCAREPSPNLNSITYAQDKYTKNMLRGGRGHDAGRYPANVVHDGSDEVLAAFAEFGELASGKASAGGHKRNARTCGGIYGNGNGLFTEAGDAGTLYGDSGSAARFFYTAKASQEERVAADDGTKHPTQKPLELMRWLVRLVTPKGGTVLDCFAGSGTTGVAAMLEGRGAVLVERDESYCGIVRKRLSKADGAGGLFDPAFRG